MALLRRRGRPEKSRFGVCRPLSGAAILTMVLGCGPGAAEKARSAADTFEAREKLRCERLLLSADAEAQPAIHVSTVSRREVARVTGMEAASDLLTDRVILRVLYTTQTSAEPAEVRLVTRSSSTAGPVTLTPTGLSRAEIARHTGETVPETTTVVTPSPTAGGAPSQVGRTLSEVGDLMVGLGRILTLDMARQTGSAPARPASEAEAGPSVRTVVPTEQDYFREAPATERLYTFLQQKRALVFQRPAETNVSLRVRISYHAMFPGQPCPLTRIVELPLPEGDSLEERIEKRFGAGTHSLARTPPAEPEDAAPASPPSPGAGGDVDGAGGQ